MASCATRTARAERLAGLVPEIPEGVDWWDPVADNAVRPGVDAVLVDGVRVAAGSRVRLRPSRRADAQDMFFAGKVARVTSVHETSTARTRRRGDRGRPGRRPARLVRPLPVLRARRSRTARNTE